MNREGGYRDDERTTHENKLLISTALLAAGIILASCEKTPNGEPAAEAQRSDGSKTSAPKEAAGGASGNAWDTKKGNPAAAQRGGRSVRASPVPRGSRRKPPSRSRARKPETQLPTRMRLTAARARRRTARIQRARSRNANLSCQSEKQIRQARHQSRCSSGRRLSRNGRSGRTSLNELNARTSLDKLNARTSLRRPSLQELSERGRTVGAPVKSEPGPNSASSDHPETEGVRCRRC